MNEKAEIGLRRRAVRLLSKGHKPSEVQQWVKRSRGWLWKWQQRYARQGIAGLHSESRRPPSHPATLPKAMTRLIAQTHRRLSNAQVGLVGAQAILHELHLLMPRQRLPCPATIYRKLHQTGEIVAVKTKPEPYYPWPSEELPTDASLDAIDWTCRFLEGGTKVYAFHTLNLRTRAMYQTLSKDKTLTTAQAHVLGAWKTRGIPRFLQLDNDAVFCGGYKVERVLGEFVRQCLFVGIELIFTPFKEPQHNYQVEQLNGLWGGSAFWKRHHFRSFHNVQHWTQKFTYWYMHDYTPPMLEGHTPIQEQRIEHRPHLTQQMQQLIPDILPITAGRIHFIRRVQPDGTIRILNEVWQVSKWLAGRYVWATVTTHSRSLDIWYRRNSHTPWRLVKHVDYDLGETVHHRISPFNKLFTMY